MQERRKPEVLAPAGSMESLKAAVAAGCDAVYIGGNRFGARAYADNPEEDEMILAIEYCHLHSVKIYMTVNTLLKEQEISRDLYDYILPYYEAGLDAVIVQDVGVLKAIHTWFPGLPIHASTQMTITTGKTAEILKEYGVDRIVPARELSLQELSRMRQDTDVELEVFVHGALCYCYSGQCLFSSMLGGRSGNRGRCAQPCRMPYRLEGEKSQVGDYLLSPKELSNLPMLGQMIDAGIDSLKIEGRMKRPEYTAFVTAMFRKYVDLHMKYGADYEKKYLSSHEKEWQEDMRKLAELYNRNGFTQGYLKGEAGVPDGKKGSGKGSMLAAFRPKHGGVCVGTVLRVDKNTVTYQLERELSAQDVVEFRDKKMIPQYEYTIKDDLSKGSKVTARYQKGCRIQTGDKVYRTKDAKLLEEIRSKYLESENKIGITGSLYAKEGQALSLELSYKESSVCVTGEVCQAAMKQSATKESVEKSIMQTGNSPFYFKQLDVRLEGDLFLPVGNLKKLRREALEALYQEILRPYRRKAEKKKVFEADSKEYMEDMTGLSVADCSKKETLSQYIAEISLLEQLLPVLETEKISMIYLRMEQMQKEELLAALEQCQASGKKAYLVLPHILRYPVWKRFEKELERKDSLFAADWSGYLIRNLESYRFLTERADVPSEKIITDYNLYMMNHYAYEFWKDRGCNQFTLPLELTRRELSEIADKEGMHAILYTHIPMMVSAQCITYNTDGCALVKGTSQNPLTKLTDQKGREFIAVNYCKYCYNTIYQQKPMSLLEEKPELQEMGIQTFRYEFLWESAQEVQNVLCGKSGFSDKTVEKGHYYQPIE